MAAHGPSYVSSTVHTAQYLAVAAAVTTVKLLSFMMDGMYRKVQCSPNGGSMSVKNLLAEQAAGFVSLHEVLTRMTQVDGASYQEAAILLHRLLWAEDEKLRPSWYEYTTLYGRRVAGGSQGKAAWECLRQAANSGLPSEWDADEIPF